MRADMCSSHTGCRFVSVAGSIRQQCKILGSGDAKALAAVALGP